MFSKRCPQVFSLLCGIVYYLLPNLATPKFKAAVENSWVRAAKMARDCTWPSRRGGRSWVCSVWQREV